MNINNFIATRILKERGIVKILYDRDALTPLNITCETCGKMFWATLPNVKKYMFGHENCPKVFVKPTLIWQRITHKE